MKNILILCAAVAALSACSEQPQNMESAAGKDAAAYTGTGKAYALAGWKQGDKADWQAKLKTRTLYGQHEYVRND